MVRIFISTMPISSTNHLFDHLLESSPRDDYIKWPDTEFGKEITREESIDASFTHLIWDM